MSLHWLRRYNLIIYNSVDSTNTEAKRLVRSGISNNFIIWANEQTQGRGRNNRIWYSEPGSLYMTIVVINEIESQYQYQIPFILANTLFETLTRLKKNNNKILDIKLKWPNDIIVNDKKISGILIESLKFNYNLYYIIGVGINILSYPKMQGIHATSLQKEGIALDRIDYLLNDFVNIFDKNLFSWILSSFDFVEIRNKWLSRAYKLNQPITVIHEGKKKSGIFNSIDQGDGSLIIKLDDNNLYHSRSAIIEDSNVVL
ncbi:biotin--[acetyl-CoA-carboxylase] ligase [Rickettsia endosymbiont of Cardiosporidium cionae]|uniref:biotin--[acetyl-CoA-carboxylase] ligase n=1 Tax=Rickettsia endosymbiont of Cardiosporidium cionae TaxID=2777155 RepID=UPI0018941A38|nr:biotin--[acetyl-CoA-carboxylase] ligase [Rickettsia endosymbiont of Cardiosporidium cionae]KAF8818309.1 biotin--[acetyl-CoA-carboxylase] ligase [Rickettsia endosymbiont of Cardiosporidium cionae]